MSDIDLAQISSMACNVDSVKIGKKLRKMTPESRLTQLFETFLIPGAAARPVQRVGAEKRAGAPGRAARLPRSFHRPGAPPGAGAPGLLRTSGDCTFLKTVLRRLLRIGFVVGHYKTFELCPHHSRIQE